MLIFPLVAVAGVPTPTDLRGVTEPAAHRAALLHPARAVPPPAHDGSGWDVDRYTFRLRLDPDARLLTGGATIEATRVGEGPLQLHADGPTLTSLRVDGVDAQWGEGALAPAGDTTIVEVAWTAPGGQVGGLQWGDVVYSFNEPIHARTWLVCHDVPDDKATVRWEITVPDGLVVVATGALQGVASQDGWSTWTFASDVPLPTYLMVLHAADYAELALDGPVPVAAFVHPGTEDAAAETFASTGAMLDLFSEVYGPYAFPAYVNVVAPFGGAMENPGAVTFSEDLVGDPWGEMVNVHELGHHWFGDDVTLGTWDDIWLNEGFATYTEALWYEHLYGGDGLVEYVAYLRASYLQWHDVEGTFPLYDPLYMWGGTVYDKGALVMHMLRGVLGDDVFFDVLGTYVARHHLGNATTSDFFAVAEAVSGEELSWFEDAWLHVAGEPTYTWGWVAQPGADGGWQIDVAIAQDLPEFTMPVPVEIALADGTIEHASVWVEGEGGAVSLCLDQEPLAVALDPEGWVLRAGEEEGDLEAGAVTCGVAPAEEAAAKGCGCATGGAAGAVGALAGLLALIRRRR